MAGQSQPGFSPRIRLAIAADVPALTELIELSVCLLQAGDYTQAQIDGALGTLLGVDTQLIADGTYFVVEVPGETGMTIAGCGGWSKRKTLFGSDRRSGREDELLDPRRDNARIRAFFVHPDWARRGIGTKILETCEAAAAEAGFTSFEMGATITGEKLYRLRGYQATGRIEARLPNGEVLPIIRMVKGRVRMPLRNAGGLPKADG